MSEWLSSKNQQTTSAGKDVKKGEHLYTAGENGHMYSYCEKQYGDTSKN